MKGWILWFLFQNFLNFPKFTLYDYRAFSSYQILVRYLNIVHPGKVNKMYFGSILQ